MEGLGGSGGGRRHGGGFLGEVMRGLWRWFENGRGGEEAF